MPKMSSRTARLRQMLNERRREVQHIVQSRVREGRADRPTVGDEIERSDAGLHEDIDLALLQMRVETLIRIDEALVRLDAGKYGSCFECAGEIADLRLRALPFAVRCLPCEQQREQAQQLTRKSGGGQSLFSDSVSS